MNNENYSKWLKSQKYMRHISGEIYVHELSAFEKMSDTELLDVLEISKAPADRRYASVELYKRGDKRGFQEIYSQFIQYKDPTVHRNLFRETCPSAAVILGELKVYEVTNDLFEALDVLGIDISYALYELGGEEVEKRVEELSSTTTSVGIYAIAVRAFMKDERVIDDIIAILDNFDSVSDGLGWYSYSTHCALLASLGGYSTPKAVAAFRRMITEDMLKHIAKDYVYAIHYSEKGSISRILAQRIGEKYNWAKFVKSKKNRYAIISFFYAYNLKNWDSYYFTEKNPFSSEDKVRQLHDKVFQNLWSSLGLTD